MIYCLFIHAKRLNSACCEFSNYFAELLTLIAKCIRLNTLNFPSHYLRTNVIRCCLLACCIASSKVLKLISMSIGLIFGRYVVESSCYHTFVFYTEKSWVYKSVSCR